MSTSATPSAVASAGRRIATGTRIAAGMARLVVVTALLAAISAVALDSHVAVASASVDIVGPSGSESFGNDVLVLSNGNFVVTDPDFDIAVTGDVGAVRLYNGTTHALISTLRGASFFDRVGSGGVVEVGNSSNFVVISSDWQSFGAPGTGAVTWVNGMTGLDTYVSSANSLVGSTTNDHVGSGGVTVLTNGNYVVASPLWHDVLGYEMAGAATWGNGNAGVSGAVAQSNSLYGPFYHDMVGSGGVTALTNGNYVVSSPIAKYVPSDQLSAGAATWGNGSIGSVGPVSIANSLVGLNSNAMVGSGGVFALTNGNYVVASPSFHIGVVTDLGAVTWATGSGPTATGVWSDNSLTGIISGDRIGSGFPGAPGVTALTNGNYVVNSPYAGVFTGAATWATGTAATVAQVSSANSLVGSAGLDYVGSRGTTALANGNYVVGSSEWSIAGAPHAGAATWGNGASGITGLVTSANSLVGGTQDDRVGQFGVTALTNGNYVVTSPSWDGAAVDTGAATWGNGTVGVAGLVTTGNSLFGTAASDSVASGGVYALANGNYVVDSPLWDGAAADVGAVTWGNGAAGSAGAVVAGNSLVGASPADGVGNGGVTALTNGNYVVNSPSWDGGAVVNAGATTWMSGGGVAGGTPSATNSLIGTTLNDQAVDAVVPLPNGTYLVRSLSWDNGAIADAGAVTFGGLTGAHGTVNSFNSVVGIAPHDISAASARFIADGAVPVERESRNIVTLFYTDVTPPSFGSAPPNITAVAAPGATTHVVTYTTPVAVEDVGVASVVCSPPSGSAFPIGVTTVSCVATNVENVTASTSFTVTVSAGTDFIPLPPTRIADTRESHNTVDGLFAGGGVRAGGSTLHLPVAGRGGVGADAIAAALNVTVTEPSAAGFVTVYPCDAVQPTASNLNFDPGSTIPNAVITKLAADGTVCIFTSQPLQLVVDVNGAFPPTTSYRPINPARVIETRAAHVTADGLQQGGGPVAAGAVTVVQITGRAGVPADATAVVLNVTITEPALAGYATVYPCDSTPPTASNLNYTPGLTIANLAVSKIGTAGTVCIFTQAATHLVADIDGYFPATTTYAPISPVRLLDTRVGFTTIDGIGAGGGARPLGTVTTVHVAGRAGVPVAARTAVLNVTVTNGTAGGYVTVYPCGIEPPLASNLNFVSAQTIPNSVITQIGTGGDVCLFNSQAADLIVDIAGEFP